VFSRLCNKHLNNATTASVIFLLNTDFELIYRSHASKTALGKTETQYLFRLGQ
jgi:hypothetical protein